MASKGYGDRGAERTEQTGAVPAVERQTGELMRTWTDPDGMGLVVRLYDTGHTRDGKSGVGFEFEHRGEVIFADVLWVPGCDGIDGDRAVQGVIGFCTLKPGDTDPDYFDDYSPRQMEWCQAEAEALQGYGNAEAPCWQNRGEDIDTSGW